MEEDQEGLEKKVAEKKAAEKKVATSGISTSCFPFLFEA